jgi:hypothetical protein
MRHSVSLALAISALLSGLTSRATAQALLWDALSSGGGFSTSVSASLGASTGQPVTGTSAGGSFLETVGFWHPRVPAPVAVEPSPDRITELRIAAIVPNPTKHEALIRFAVPAGLNQSISIEVIDLSGRLVRALSAGSRPPGFHSLLWDGRAADGSLAPSGMYFCRLQAGGHRSVRRLALIR